MFTYMYMYMYVCAGGELMGTNGSGTRIGEKLRNKNTGVLT